MPGPAPADHQAISEGKAQEPPKAGGDGPRARQLRRRPPFNERPWRAMDRWSSECSSGAIAVGAHGVRGGCGSSPSRTIRRRRRRMVPLDESDRKAFRPSSSSSRPRGRERPHRRVSDRTAAERSRARLYWSYGAAAADPYESYRIALIGLHGTDSLMEPSTSDPEAWTTMVAPRHLEIERCRRRRPSCCLHGPVVPTVDRRRRPSSSIARLRRVAGTGP